eukprot:3011-Heterocapsa_arctica.AAC.1
MEQCLVVICLVQNPDIKGVSSLLQSWKDLQPVQSQSSPYTWRNTFCDVSSTVWNYVSAFSFKPTTFRKYGERLTTTRRALHIRLTSADTTTLLCLVARLIDRRQ